MTTVAENEAAHTLPFTQALEQAEAQARSTLAPALHGRLSDAVALVQNGRVFQTSTGEWQVDSTSRTGLTYSVNGSCTCDDHHFNKPRWCKHQLAMFLSQRVCTLMQPPAPQSPAVETEPPPPPVPEAPAPAPEPAPAPGKRAIPAHFLQQIQGQTFIKYAGLLQLAHERGLQELRATWTFNDGELSLARAVALFPFGTFEECGDSTPESGRRVGVHWRRMSLTRAKARCLRDALGLDLCSLEEME